MSNPFEGNFSKEDAENYEKFAGLKDAGKLQEISAKELIFRLHCDQFTGHLILSSREKKKKLWFVRGEIARVQSNLAPELFGNLMLERDLVNEAHLQTCIDLQKSLIVNAQPRKLGHIAAEVCAIDRSVLEKLFIQQQLISFVQALHWDEGDYILYPKAIDVDERMPLTLFEMMDSLDDLFLAEPAPLGKLFEFFNLWSPSGKSTELARVPFWIALAGCRAREVSGILSLRKQHQFFEIVFKSGIPLTLYEGTFSRPRQTVVVRQASDEHEKYFLKQISKFASFLSGNLYFRSVGSSASEDASVPEDTRVFSSFGDDAEEKTNSKVVAWIKRLLRMK